MKFGHAAFDTQEMLVAFVNETPGIVVTAIVTSSAHGFCLFYWVPT